MDIKEKKAHFAHNMLLNGGFSYWGNCEMNYRDDQENVTYDTIPESYTIVDRNDEFPDEEADSTTFSPVELADAFIDYAEKILEDNRNGVSVNPYFKEWAKHTIAYDFDDALCCDADVVDCAVQYAMFGRTVYA